MRQKTEISVGGVSVKTAGAFDSNFREKSPTVAEVVVGNKYVAAGDILLCHHNLFYTPSPHFVLDDTFSIPFSKILFAKVKSDGSIEPICGNIIVERIPIETDLPLPIEQRKTHDKMYKVLLSGWTKFKPETIIYTRPSSGYTIVYAVNGIETRIVKVDSDMICGYIKPSKK